MSERRIKVDTMDAVWPGMFVTEPDEDETPLGALVDADVYDAADQDWQRVVARSGYVDLPTYVLAGYDGEPYTQKIQSSARVWILVEERGGDRYEPVIHEG